MKISGFLDNLIVVLSIGDDIWRGWYFLFFYSFLGFSDVLGFFWDFFLSGDFYIGLEVGGE